MGCTHCAHLDGAHQCWPHGYAACDAAGNEELRTRQHVEHDAPRLVLTRRVDSPGLGGRTICVKGRERFG